MTVQRGSVLRFPVIMFFAVLVAATSGCLSMQNGGDGGEGRFPALEEPTNNQGSGGNDPILSGAFAAIWANDGGDKVTRDERRGAASAAAVVNSVWNGTGVQIFGAKNEVVSFNLVLEAQTALSVPGVSVRFETLTGPGGAQIRSVPTTASGVFDWTQRNIELFFVRYLKIEGLSRLSYGTYDERHIPKRLRRPWTGQGVGSGVWTDRPDHDKHYPEIAVPMELVPSFTVAAGENQSVWADVYIPKTVPAGNYFGNVEISRNGTVTDSIPVTLRVRNFTLPDAPAGKTMLYLGYQDINKRYTGISYPNANTSQDTLSKQVRDRHFLLAHRHKISMIDQNVGATAWSADAPRPEWIPRLNGTLFSAANGYDGPGVGVGNDVFAIGTYGTWSWKAQGEAGMWTHMDAWQNWFATNAPSVERFLYLIDESTNYAQTEQWAGWAASNPGVGASIPTFATIALPEAVSHVPSLNIAASWFAVAPLNIWENASIAVQNDPDKKFYVYNGKRPASGSFATEDDGVALRSLSWSQYKKKVDRWFFWEGTYYNNYQGGMGETNVFQNAMTFGTFSSTSAVTGKTGWNYSNGDGVLFYPGIDQVFPSESYGLAGPIASLRLKHWRRGVQDIDYLALAYAIDPTRTAQIVQQMVPKALWEYDVSDPGDPTWVRSDISWSIDPDDWEAARSELADIIEP